MLVNVSVKSAITNIISGAAVGRRKAHVTIWETLSDKLLPPAACRRQQSTLPPSVY